jgi:RND family efflux transporter MFP subunit
MIRIGALPMACRIVVLFLPGTGLAGARLCADEAKPRQVVLALKGYLMPARQVTVGPSVRGRVVELRCEEGQRVRAGDVLARLDPTEYELAVRIAQARLEVTRARVEKARKVPVAQDIAIAEAELVVAQARLSLAKHHLDATVVRASTNGTVLVKKAEVGTLLDPAAFNVGASLCELADLREVDVDVQVPERDLAKVTKGQPCTVTLEAFPDRQYKGRVVRLAPVADRARASVAVRVRVEPRNADESLRPESAAVVEFLSRK